MTIRLDWQDAYLQEFQATVVASVDWKGKPALILDRTCFYPTSGGQPHDTGMLAGVRVVDVVEDQDGRVIHVLADTAPELAPGASVSGEIDWCRRFDHMQQHTGQHVLSAAFDSGLGASTLSFHLGPQVCTIDVDARSVTENDLDVVEERANAWIWANIPIKVQVHTAEEAALLPLRKAPAVDEDIRVVTVPEVDASACCGTHVRFTGELGSIHIRRVERNKEHLRVEFLVGARAMRDYAERDRLIQAVATAQSVAVGELPVAVERLAQAQSDATKRANAWRKRWLDSAWLGIAEQAEELAGVRLVSQVLEGLDAGNMRYLAQQIISLSGYVVMFAVAAPSPQFCFGRSDDLDLDMGKLLREAAGPLGGRGGGRPNMAQGGGIGAEDLETLLAHGRSLLES